MAARGSTPQIVGVIFSRLDLQRATRMRRPPDFFELRLDALVRHLDEVESALERLPARLILTARDPREGGLNRLSLRARRDLLMRFLPHAHGLDIELRSAHAFRSILALARARKIRRIISVHDFKNTPAVSRLREKVRAAEKFRADIFKIATRTDTTVQLNRLLDFFGSTNFPTAAMGIGRLGRIARRELIKRGSVLNYVHLGRTRIAGQPSLSDIRRINAAAGKVR